MKSGLLLLLGLLALWAELPPASGQLRQVKRGECLAPIKVGAANCKHFCSTDADCPGSERCCSNGCGGECRLPIGVNPGYCPKFNSSRVTICLVECSNDSKCGAGNKCCSLGCHVQCTPAVPAKPGTCPKRRVLQTFAPCENKCSDDRNCPNRQKCCFTGCGLGCLAPETGDICRLPPKTGPCKRYIPRFFYHPASRTCKRFIYGGCQGNGNNFRTLQECQRACRKRAKETCKLPVQPGPRSACSRSYFYYSVTKTCDEFLYGGCQGSGNNWALEPNVSGPVEELGGCVYTTTFAGITYVIQKCEETHL